MEIQGPVELIFIIPAYGVTYLWGLVSVVFSPVAAVTCMWLARRRGLKVWYYGLIGAIYSVFFLYPWIYLATRMLGRRMSRKIVTAGYINMYVWWIAWLYSVFHIATLPYGEPDIEDSLKLVQVFIGSTAAVGSALALLALVSIHNRSRREEFGQNVRPFLGGDTPSSRKLIAGYVVFCVIWFILLFTVYVYGIYTRLLYGSLVLVSSVFIAIPAIFAVGLAWTLIRNRNYGGELGQNVQPFLGGYTLNSRDLIYIAPFALAFVTFIVACVMGVLLNALKNPFQ